jgi:HK97 family phage portal protein
MPTVSSFGTLTHFDRTAPPFASAPVAPVSLSANPYQYQRATYSRIYQTQPAVRTCVDFLARNMGQLGLHVFRRVSDTDRVRLMDFPLTQWIEKPNPSTTRYRLIESLMADMGIYFNAYWLKVREPGTRKLKGLVRMPPETVTVTGWLMPQAFIWTAPGGASVTLPPEDVVYFDGYNATGLGGISPIETLRCVLAEYAASTSYRAQFWNNAARPAGVIQRPLAAPRWNTEQKQAFREQWQERYGGANNAGATPLLDEGMTYVESQATAKDSEYIDSRKLTREEVASEYHIPLPMVGILDHATFSNIKEQHKELYQDTLGPWCVQLEEEIDRQLLPECDNAQDVYVEFNIQEKLKGSFEDQANAMRVLVGRPIMTANEGRARLNLPSIKDDPTADQLAMPLNLGTDQSQAASYTTALGAVPLEADAVEPVLRATWGRQAARLAKVASSQRAEMFVTSRSRWDRELARDLNAWYLRQGRAAVDADERSTDLARRINDETLTLLIDGRDPFAQREGTAYAE